MSSDASPPASSTGASPPPGRRHPVNNPTYEKRAASGMYDKFSTQLENMGLTALTNVEYPDDITRKITEWNKEASYVNADGTEFRASVLGEIGGTAMGTVLRSTGNFYAGRGDNFRPIVDKTKVRDTIALCVPTCSTVKCYNTCINQCIALGQITAADADEDARKGEFPVVKEWTKASVEGRQQHDVIVVHLEPKYSVPSAAGAPKVRRVAKRKLDEVDDETPVDRDDPGEFPGPDDIKLGAHYEPTLLPDFGGDMFNLTKGKLAQQNIKNKKGELIPPWKIYEELRPGTLVLALVTLHVYNMMDTFGKEPKKRKVYQLHAESIRILDPSDEHVDARSMPVPPSDFVRATSSLPGRAVSSFNNFVVPEDDDDDTPPADPPAEEEQLLPDSDAMAGVETEPAAEGSAQKKKKRTRN
ncbi:hypothetical protein C8R43DRAFT_1136625 [Mycena crocata]|nr:hypothetical protein C8R43DRAFT_1136625 [Mycena crocata]